MNESEFSVGKKGLDPLAFLLAPIGVVLAVVWPRAFRKFFLSRSPKGGK